MSETNANINDGSYTTLTDGYTFIYNRILSSLLDDGVLDGAARIQSAKRITDAIWELHLSVNGNLARSEKYNNYSNTKSMVSSIIRSFNQTL
jgi:hypothetical protein